MKAFRLGLACSITWFCLGAIIGGSGDTVIVVTMLVGICAAGLVGYLLRGWEADQDEVERREIARSIETRSTTAGDHWSSHAERPLRRQTPPAEPGVVRGERHPFVTRPDGDPDSPPAPERRSPRG